MKRNVLTVPRRLELIQWLQKHKDRLFAERPAYEVVASLASQELGFAVTASNVRTAAQRGQCVWRVRPCTTNSSVDHPAQRLAQEIVRIEERLGMAIPLSISVLASDPRANEVLLATAAKLSQEIVRIEEHLGMEIPLSILVLARDPRANAVLMATVAKPV